MAMMNNPSMTVPDHMGAPGSTAGNFLMESGVQPVRAVPNPSYPAARPPVAPQVSGRVFLTSVRDRNCVCHRLKLVVCP